MIEIVSGLRLLCMQTMPAPPGASGGGSGSAEAGPEDGVTTGRNGNGDTSLGPGPPEEPAVVDNGGSHRGVGATTV